MDQEKIGQKIKSIRLKNNLSQQKFASKYGVTYQAVSKWENGKNIPDIAIIKQICDDYQINIEEFLGSNPKKKNNKYIFIILIIFLILIIGIILFKMYHNHNFEFKTIAPNCSNFKLYGSIAYNNKKSSIYISNVTYCGESDNTEYKKINCTLYEYNGRIRTEISQCNNENTEPITLEEYLNSININVDHYESSCKIYKDNSLYMEIEAISSDDTITTYKIPLKLEDNCE